MQTGRVNPQTIKKTPNNCSDSWIQQTSARFPSPDVPVGLLTVGVEKYASGRISYKHRPPWQKCLQQDGFIHGETECIWGLVMWNCERGIVLGFLIILLQGWKLQTQKPWGAHQIRTRFSPLLCRRQTAARIRGSSRWWCNVHGWDRCGDTGGVSETMLLSSPVVPVPLPSGRRLLSPGVFGRSRRLPDRTENPAG